MLQYARFALVLWTVVVAAAVDTGRWVRVHGGAWDPSPAILSELETALKPAVTSAARNRGRLAPWSEYTFQYQGRNSPLARRFVYVNAFCRYEGGSLSKEWVQIDDGGACFFSAKYDPDKKLIYDVEVNCVG